MGGTKLEAGIVSAQGELLDTLRTPTQLDLGPEGVTRQLLDLGLTLLQRTSAKISGVGVGCGGPLDRELGIIQDPPNLPGWTDFPLKNHLEAGLSDAGWTLPIALDNDANAAALAELRFGAGRGFQHLIYLTISTGIGGGVILDGQLYAGKNGNAGELGHLQVEVHGERCNCGGRGCLEQYASGSSIARRARAVALATPNSLLNTLAPDPLRITAHTVLQALEGGDAATLAFWDETLEYLAAGVASTVHAFDPQRVVIGGGVSNFGEWLFPPLRARVQARTMPALWQGLEICRAELADHVGIFGAAAVALSQNWPSSSSQSFIQPSTPESALQETVP
ncbi:Glucokinase [Deinococcus saxicola]|uniref:ROK family protein n=1 Tax=Deinococcus saxicola TaxID=249406 RepID=UPI0039F0C537